jgi:hypothetical protein
MLPGSVTLSTPVLLLGAIALAPVLLFLAGLLQLDGYKLLRLPTVLAMVAAGALAGGASYFANSYAFEHFSGDFTAFSHYVSPWIEECLKALLLVFLVRTRRVGLPVDAGIAGFGEPVLPRVASGHGTCGADHPRLWHGDHARRHDDPHGHDLRHPL